MISSCPGEVDRRAVDSAEVVVDLDARGTGLEIPPLTALHSRFLIQCPEVSVNVSYRDYTKISYIR